MPFRRLTKRCRLRPTNRLQPRHRATGPPCAAPIRGTGAPRRCGATALLERELSEAGMVLRGPADEVHARSVAGIRQVHHRTSGTSRAGSGSVPGHRRPRIRTQCGYCPGRDDATSQPMSAARCQEAQAGARRSRRAPRRPADPATMLRATLRNRRCPRRPVTAPDGYHNPYSERFGEPLLPPSRPE
jgi:hypothetical protein